MKPTRNIHLAIVALHQLGGEATAEAISKLTNRSVASVYGTKYNVIKQGWVQGGTPGQWVITPAGTEEAQRWEPITETPDKPSNAPGNWKKGLVAKPEKRKYERKEVAEVKLTESDLKREKMVLANNLLTTFNNIFKD